VTTAQSLSTVVFTEAQLSVIATVIGKTSDLLADIIKLLKESEVLDSESEVAIRIRVPQEEGPLQIIAEAIIEPQDGDNFKIECSLLLRENPCFDIKVEIFKEAPASTTTAKTSAKSPASTEASDNWMLFTTVVVPGGGKDEKWNMMVRRIFSDLEFEIPESIKSEK